MSKIQPVDSPFPTLSPTTQSGMDFSHVTNNICFALLFFLIFIHLKGTVSWKETHTERRKSAVHCFSPQVALTARAGPGARTSILASHACGRGPRTGTHHPLLARCICKELDWKEAEKPGLEYARSVLSCCSTKPGQRRAMQTFSSRAFFSLRESQEGKRKPTQSISGKHEALVRLFARSLFSGIFCHTRRVPLVQLGWEGGAPPSQIHQSVESSKILER